MTDEPTRYCDLVMKGGITSGIVYPNAVLALARDFRFKNIGGTSAGAIAAAASAAAAVGDRKHVASGAGGPAPGMLGFEGLKQVSRQLSTEGFIYGLFQPARGARNAYRTIVILAGNASPLRKGLAAFVGVVAIAPFETVLLLGLFLGVGFWAAGWGAGGGAAVGGLCLSRRRGLRRAARGPGSASQPARPVLRAAPAVALRRARASGADRMVA
jgi:hypothetical protein